MATLTEDRPPTREPGDGPDATDPRFRARRALVAAERLSTRRRWARSGLVVVTLVAAALLVLRSPFLDVDDVLVDGASRTTASSVAAATHVAPGIPLVDVDIDGATRRLEALPWVQSAAVERSWWGTVSIDLVERTPFAQVVDGDRYLVVDRSGRVLATSALATPALLTFEGSEAAEAGGQLGRRYDEVAAIGEQLAPGVRTRVVAITTSPSGQVSLVLRSRGRVVWGAPDQTAAKVRALTTILGQVDLAGICTIDVRVPTTPVVTRAC